MKYFSEFIILGIFSSLILFSNNTLYGQQQQGKEQDVNVDNSEPEFLSIQHARSALISKVNAIT